VRLPTPALGLVVHYGFVWAGPVRPPPPDIGKSRPCVIVDLRDEPEPGLSGRVVRRVTYLPITHVAPRDAETAIAVPPRVARHLRLDRDISYIYTSYAVQDDWPFDLGVIPGTADRCDYGFIPPRLFAAITDDFKAFLARAPAGVHRRDA
jgi:hypothetical protein